MLPCRLIAAGEQKVKVMCEVVSDENVNFVWEIATDISDEKLEVTQEWFVIRGFLVASQILEQYKKATIKISKAQKEYYISISINTMLV